MFMYSKTCFVHPYPDASLFLFCFSAFIVPLVSSGVIQGVFWLLWRPWSVDFLIWGKIVEH